MKTFSPMTKEVDDFVASKVLPQYRDIAERLRALMRECVPDAFEVISYGVPMWRRKKMLAVLSPTKKGITFALSQGASFEDRYGLLEGVGNRSKNVRMKTVADINDEALRYYIAQAVTHDDR